MDSLIPQPSRNSPLVAYSFLLAVVAVWSSLFFRLSYVWDAYDQYSHGWLVPFLAAWIFWRHWDERPSPSAYGRLGSFVALAVLVFPGALALLVSESSPDWRPVLWLLAAVVVGASLALCQIAGGSAWRKFFVFPFFFALVSVPWPFGLETSLTFNLSLCATAVTTLILQFLGIVADSSGNTITLGAAVLGVEDACSGIRSLQSSLMAGLFLGELYQLRVKWRVFLCLAGGLLAYLLNIIRLLLLSLVVELAGSESIDRWHDPAGYLILLITLAALWQVCRVLIAFPSAFRVDAPRSPLGFCGGIGPAFPVLGVVVILAVPLMFAATEVWYRSRESGLVQAPSWSVIPASSETGVGADQPLPASVHKALGYDQGFQRYWTDEQGRNLHLIYLRWEAGRRAPMASAPHLPEICQTASGREIIAKSEQRLASVNGLQIPYYLYTIEKSSIRFYLLFVPNSGDGLDSSADQYGVLTEASGDHRWARLRWALCGLRNVGQRSLQLALTGEDSAADAEKEILATLRGLLRRDDK
jgi:exosortase